MDSRAERRTQRDGHEEEQGTEGTRPIDWIVLIEAVFQGSPRTLSSEGINSNKGERVES